MDSENTAESAGLAGLRRILAVSITPAGQTLSLRLPLERVHGNLGATMRARWNEVEAFVLFAAVGIAARVAGPLLRSKLTDPAVVCVSEDGRWVVPVVGGHEGGANQLATEVAAALGATAVITTAGEVSPPPSSASRSSISAPGGSLIAGIGASRGAPAAELSRLLAEALAEAGLTGEAVGEVATHDLKADEPGILALGLPMRTYPSDRLRQVQVPNPSSTVDRAVGTPSVAEAAALIAAGPGGMLLVPKQVSAHATVAIARRSRPRGHLAIVGLGPGDPAHRTPAASDAVRRAEVVIGYTPYLAQASDLLGAEQEIVESPIGDESIRAKQAVAEAEAGRHVALVCSGDAGVYAMASLVFELVEQPDADIVVVPGVTAATSAASLLGAPLGHDHVFISLSDLLTPWELIERRIEAAAAADLVVALYNPRSRGRAQHLDRAREILLTRRLPSTPVGIVRSAYRPEQEVEITTLAELAVERVNMTTIVLIGSSMSFIRDGRIITPRGYQT